VDPKNDNSESRIISDHRRQWRDCRYVYPVISRRAKGLSIGVNLNPDKRCNFGCLYCQIDRTTEREFNEVQIAALHDELKLAIEEALNGGIWAEDRFSKTPARLRRINDIAFSGDGEPTCVPEFDQAVATAAELRKDYGCDDLKLVVITNATQMRSPQFQCALPILDANNGEIWAKLDAGTEEYFQRVNRPSGDITLEQIVEDITETARHRPLVIQTLMFRIDGNDPPGNEIDAYCQRLRDIVDAGGKIKLVQLHTIARTPDHDHATALPNDHLDNLADIIRKTVGNLTLETFYAAK
jgi:wyosine [tRNA(Phe)-imidazoG37] synthetase (radical SAM superfamily)